jgi:predicted transposase YdaD
MRVRITGDRTEARVDFDATLKDLFQRDRPTLLRRLCRGVPVKEFLNVELPRVSQRRVDLLLSLADGSLLHIEFQTSARRNIPYRMLEYWGLIKGRFHRPLRQAVVFAAPGRWGHGELVEDGVRFEYETLGLADLDAKALIETGNPGDLSLAVLAGGGDRRVREIVSLAARAKGSTRDRLLVQILILSRLRGISGKVQWEIERMNIHTDIREIPEIRKLWDEYRAEGLAEAVAKGKAEGEAKGRAEGMAKLFREQLTIKFGPLPRWAEVRVAEARPNQVQRWAKKILSEDTLEAVIGPRRNGARGAASQR